MNRTLIEEAYEFFQLPMEPCVPDEVHLKVACVLFHQFLGWTGMRLPRPPELGNVIQSAELWLFDVMRCQLHLVNRARQQEVRDQYYSAWLNTRTFIQAQLGPLMHRWLRDPSNRFNTDLKVYYEKRGIKL